MKLQIGPLFQKNDWKDLSFNGTSDKIKGKKKNLKLWQ
jgi:hypothetical protein